MNVTTSSTPAALTIKQFCATMNVSASLVYKLARTGQLKVIHLAGRTLIPTSEVDRLISGAKASGGAN